MSNDEIDISITELSWPINEADLGLLWQMPNLPADFLGSLNRPKPDSSPGQKSGSLDATKRFLITAKRAAVTEPQTVAAVACMIPAVGYARVWAPFAAGSEPNDSNSSPATRVLAQAAKLATGLGEPENAQTAPADERRTIAVVDVADTAFADQLRHGGFSEVCRVLHLLDAGNNSSGGDPNGAFPAEERITLQPVADAEKEQFFELVKTTYAQSDDCPALSPRHSIDEVRHRWLQTPNSERSNGWFTVSVASHSENIGCLVLNMPAHSANAELVYMGLVPGQRRKGFGSQLVTMAKRLKRGNGRTNLTLSVDSSNEAALQCYTSNGFVHYAESLVFLDASSL